MLINVRYSHHLILKGTFGFLSSNSCLYRGSCIHEFSLISLSTDFEEVSWKENITMDDSVICVRNESYKLRLESLPNEILFLILEHLMPIDLISCYNTSTEMCNVVTRMEVFRNKCKLAFDIFNFFWV